MKKLLLGTSEAVITPEVGCNLYGYDLTTFSESVHDDLTASVFLFRNDGSDALLVSLTLCEANEKVCDELRNIACGITGVPFENIMICCTHTHSGPDTVGNAGWGDLDRKYIDTVLIPNYTEAVKRAAADVRPVKLGIGRGESLIGVNRRQILQNGIAELGQNPWGCFDPNMTVLSFIYEDGTPAANIIHYACHGTCAGKNHEISRDFAGVMCDRVKKLFGGVTAFINGAEGDVGPRLSNGRTTGMNDISYAEEHGGAAAADAARIRRGIRSYSDAVLSAGTYSVELPVKKRISTDEAKTIYDRYGGKTVNIEGQYAHYAKSVMESYENGYSEVKTKKVPQTVIRLGDVVIAGFPFELFSEIARRVSAYSDAPYVLCCSLCNGAYGYFPTADQHIRGGYEVYMFNTSSVQPFDENADTAYVNGTVKNIEDIMKENN